MENSSNITQIIIETINTLFQNLFSSIDNQLYSTLDKITFINSDILTNSYFEKLFGSSPTSGILLIANSFLLGYLLYFSVCYLLSHFTYSKIETPSNFIFKLILSAICMNSSFFILNQFIDLTYQTSFAIQKLGETLLGKSICFSELINSINSNASVFNSTLDIFSFDGLLKTSLSLSLVNLVFSYSFRYIMIKVFILLSPFAFLSISLNSTSWFFKTWFRNLFSLLFIQIIVSLILLILFSFSFSTNDLFSKLIYIGGIYSLIKANSFVRDFLGGISTDFTQNVGTLLSKSK